jgi:Putative bacterial sensory transduction regulator
MKATLIAILSSVALLAGVTAAGATDLPAGGMTVSDIAGWLQKSGYPVTVITNSDQSQVVESTAEGNRFDIEPDDCDKTKRCASFQFYVLLDPNPAYTLAKINDWNRKKRWARALIDSGNNALLEMDVDLSPGGTLENLNDQFAVWRDLVKAFYPFMQQK